VHDAFQHLKVIGHGAQAQPLLDKAGAVPDAGLIALGGDAAADRYIAAAATVCISGHEAKVRTICRRMKARALDIPTGATNPSG
jgi:catalase